MVGVIVGALSDAEFGKNPEMRIEVIQWVDLVCRWWLLSVTCGAKSHTA
jgi:hypothetical protein